MLTRNLFEEILIAPAKRTDVDRLQIISGFATSGMCYKHRSELSELNLDRQINIDLIVGMAVQHGIDRVQHEALQKLVGSNEYGINFNCRYLVREIPVHAKTYCWASGNSPKIAFLGSANYTQTGFGTRQIEAMREADCERVSSFWKDVFPHTEDCMSQGIEQRVSLTEKATAPSGENENIDSVSLSLLVRGNDTPKKSGINWGQRERREPNQAYIPIPKEVRDREFFPKIGEHFTVKTDDNFLMYLVVAQEGEKAIESPENNSLLGSYLRKRMGLESGCYVKREDLETYGRTDVTFIKLDNETYLLDFSVEGKEKSDSFPKVTDTSPDFFRI